MVSRKVIQILGTSSNSGKTILTAGMLRALNSRGYRAAPFKAVNMSLNSIAIGDSAETSRSVWLQCKAARIEPVVEMNPFLLKPEAGGRSQVIRLGESAGPMDYTAYSRFLEEKGKETITRSLERLSTDYEVIVAEGAGSAAEINFRGKDLANSFVSGIFRTPAIVVADIRRGGAFASIHGTYWLMENKELARWFVINGMNGDGSLLRTGIAFLEQETGMKHLGTLQYRPSIRLPGEDSLDYDFAGIQNPDIAVVRYPHMENQSDIDPLILSGVGFIYVDHRNPSAIRHAKAIILPGSKDVFRDLEYLRNSRLGELLLEAASEGKKILGICGGYQMLGRGISSRDEAAEGFGLLNVSTTYMERKTVRNLRVRPNPDLFDRSEWMDGYEIHFGHVQSSEASSLFLTGTGREGSVAERGNVAGTNVHSVLESGYFMERFLGVQAPAKDYSVILEENIESLSHLIEESLDVDEILAYVNGT